MFKYQVCTWFVEYWKKVYMIYNFLSLLNVAHLDGIARYIGLYSNNTIYPW